MSTITDAMHGNMLRAVHRIGRLTPSSAAERVGPWLLIDAGVGMTRFNQAMVAGAVESPAVAVGEALRWFERRAIGSTFILRDPMDRALAVELESRGFEQEELEPAMLLERLPAACAPPPGLTVQEVRTQEEIERYGSIDAPAWHVVTMGIARTVSEFPDFTMFLGSIDGQDVATSMAVVTGGLVGVYNVQVRPDFRGRGLGRAMTEAALAAGSRHGCRAATLQSTEMGLPVYERMGFTTQYKIVRYLRPGSDE